MLQEFGPSLYVADGPEVSFFGFPYPTRMAVAKLTDGSAWVWSPVALTPELEAAVEAVGPVRNIVSPNKIHHLFLTEWAKRWPDANIYALPGLAQRKPELRIDKELTDTPEPDWEEDIDQVIFHGSFLMEEVVFFHRPSRTAIVCDLVQRHSEERMTGWKGMLMRLDGLVGEHGSTPREWRASFLRRSATLKARDELLGWSPEKLIIAHGECARHDATEILSRALAWIG